MPYVVVIPFLVILLIGVWVIGVVARAFVAGTSSGAGPLHRAAMRGHLPDLERLLFDDADVNVRDRHGATPLHYAARRCQAGAADLLLKHRADIEAVDAQGATPLRAAAEAGCLTALRVLLTEGAAMESHARDLLNRDAGTPLFAAVGRGHPEVAAVLLQAGADPNARRGDGTSALHVAATVANRAGAVRLAEELLGRGADANARNNLGSTPLHWAAESDNPRVAYVLLAHGADAAARDENGRTPAERAAWTGRVRRVLRAHGH